MNDFQNYQDAEMAISKAFIDYNQKRIHSALGYKTPLNLHQNGGR